MDITAKLNIFLLVRNIYIDEETDRNTKYRKSQKFDLSDIVLVILALTGTRTLYIITKI